MNAFVRVLAPFMATLSMASAFADVRPVGDSTEGPVTPVPSPDRGPGRGHGYPYPAPGYPYPAPGPGYPPPAGQPPARYPQMMSLSCREMDGGYETLNISGVNSGYAQFLVDIDALGIYATQLPAFVSNQMNDSLILQVQSPFGMTQIQVGYLSHPYGPTAVLSIGGTYQQFHCSYTGSSYPPPPSQPYPPAPYPPSPYPYPHR